MKPFLLLFACIVAWLAYEAHTYVPPVAERKTVLKTISSVETIRQGYPETCYYVIATDGTSAPCSRAQFVTLDSGDVVSSAAWER